MMQQYAMQLSNRTTPPNRQGLCVLCIQKISLSWCIYSALPEPFYWECWRFAPPQHQQSTCCF